VIDWIRHDLPHRLRRAGGGARGTDSRLLLGGAGLLAAIAVAWAVLAGPLSGEDQPETSVAPVVIETGETADAPAGPLGFPLVATRNTTRVGGADPVSDAAAVALATHPPSGLADPIEAAVLVEGGSPYAGIAASVLAGPPLRAPVLIGDDAGVPEPTGDALSQLNPRGGSGPSDAAVYLVGDVAAPSGYQSQDVEGGSPAEIAAAVDELRGRLLGAEPEHIVIASSEEPAYAMPAASWAARSGDPVLFSGRDQVPEATVAALRRHRGVPVYVLGPPSAVSAEAVRQIERVSPGVQRVGAEGRVASAVAFARFSDGDFGWNINDPGHGMVLAATSRPLDATAAATLSASGKWGPLLLIETPATLPPELRDFLLDIKPGFQDDPTRAVYNHVWLIGDSTAIGGRVQAEIDELAELAEVGPGAGGPVGEAEGAVPGFAQPGGTDSEPQPQPGGAPQSGNKGGAP
jgi:hypothetical protein